MTLILQKIYKIKNNKIRFRDQSPYMHLKNNEDYTNYFPFLKKHNNELRNNSREKLRGKEG